jgi:hypothetical protein
MTVFTATFSAVSVSAAQDLFELVTSATNRLRIREIRISQHSDFGDAQSELIQVTLVRGNTVAGSGGSAVTPRNLEPWSRAAVTTAAANNTTVASSGGVVMLADAWNVAAGWLYAPSAEERIRVDINSRFCVRITAPTDALTVNGTIVFEEIGGTG